MSYRVLALKWRPQTFADLTGQTHVSRTLSNALRTGRAAHAYLFTGPRGVGKTSMARILAKAINCENGTHEEPCNVCDPCLEITAGRSLDVIEIDGASNRGIDDIRELREKVRYAPARLRTKVYIIDEVHMLTTDAFNALLKTLEEPPPHVVFVLATTEPLKVPATILSRCQRFDFARLRVRDAVERLATICRVEEIEAEPGVLELVARKGDGSMRDALTLLDQVVATGESPLTTVGVRAALGLIGRDVLFDWTGAMRDQDPARALLALAHSADRGSNLVELADEFVLHLRNLLLAATDPSLEEWIDGADDERAQYREQAVGLQTGDLVRACRIAMDAAVQMRRSPSPRVHLDVALAEICRLPRSLDLRRFIEASRRSLGPEETTVTRSAPAATLAATPPAVTPIAVTPIAVTPPAQTIEVIAPTKSSDEGARWNAVVVAVAARKPALAAYLSGSHLLEQTGTSLRVAMPGANPFTIEQLERSEPKKLLAEIVEAAFGMRLSLKWEAASAAAATAPVSARAERSPSAPPASASAVSGPTSSPTSGDAASPERIHRLADLLDGDVIGPA